MISRVFNIAAVAATLTALGTGVVAGECYNKIDDRDKWLAGWVYWIPAKGEKVELRGKTYTQAKAISYAKKDIPAAFKKRGGDIKESAAGVSALEMIKAKNNTKRAMKAYEKQKLGISWDDAVACWVRYKGKV